ncbi:MAG: type I pantothenate kinase, partial [Hyphomicrobiaceae bacterium]|nr:type I pantothenate kinase [Hyphomicrobiaceae bacterium]
MTEMLEKAAKAQNLEFSPYQVFTREEWARLRADTLMTLAAAELRQLSGVIEEPSVSEVEEIYLPMSRLLNLYAGASQQLHAVISDFLGKNSGKVPFIIGLAGSVAVGKSTVARVLRALLARWPNTPRVDLVTTDGFLKPNHELQALGIMHRKGFPESFNTAQLLNFLADVKAGRPRVEAPVYSH